MHLGNMLHIFLQTDSHFCCKPPSHFSTLAKIHAGNGDKFLRGKALRYGHIPIRANGTHEPCTDLGGDLDGSGPVGPTFSTCMVPLVLWMEWPFNVGELFHILYVRLWHFVQSECWLGYSIRYF